MAVASVESGSPRWRFGLIRRGRLIPGKRTEILTHGALTAYPSAGSMQSPPPTPRLGSLFRALPFPRPSSRVVPALVVYFHSFAGEFEVAVPIPHGRLRLADVSRGGAHLCSRDPVSCPLRRCASSLSVSRTNRAQKPSSQVTSVRSFWMRQCKTGVPSLILSRDPWILRRVLPASVQKL